MMHDEGGAFGFWFGGHGGHGFGRGFGRHRGFGGRGRVFGGSGDDGTHGWAGRKLGSEALQLVILAMLEEKPGHGYELIKRLEERSGGFYSPSPGMVYPALTYLEEIGHASVEVDGAKKLYSITDAGREQLGQRRTEAEAILKRLETIGGRMDDVRRAFAGEGFDEDRISPNARLRQARGVLKQAFLLVENPTQEQIEKLTQVLLHAAGEVTRIARER